MEGKYNLPKLFVSPADVNSPGGDKWICAKERPERPLQCGEPARGKARPPRYPALRAV